MSLTSTRALAGLACLLLACSQGSSVPSSKRGNTTGAAQSGATAGSNAQPMMGKDESQDDQTTPENSDDLIKTVASAAGAGGTSTGAAGSGGAPAAGDDGCEVGKFCKPTVPDPTNCGKLDLQTNTKTVLRPGNVMVIFDRSGSMEADWGGAPKYQAAGNALVAAITPLKDQLSVGGVFFPSAGMDMMNCPMGCNVADPTHWIPGPGACCLNTVAGGCSVSTIDQPDQLNFGTAESFIGALPMQWHIGAAAGTPLGTGIQRAAEAISARSFKDPLMVLVMTDGEPNCDTDPQKVLDQISAWNKSSVPTYVVGLPGAQAAADVLNSMAMAGGTDSYIDPKDPQELETRLRSAISTTVRAGFESCTFHLDQKADAPEKLHLIVKQAGMESDVPRDLSKSAHWKINAAGDEVELEGQLCDMAKDGTFEGLRFVYGCVDVPPLKPPPEPMLN